MKALVAAAVAVASTAQAQNFKVQKVNIGGEGGTDYVTAEIMGGSGLT